MAAIWGLLIGDTVLGVIRVDELGGADHAVEAILLLIGWAVSAPATGWTGSSRARKWRSSDCGSGSFQLTDSSIDTI